MSCSYGPGRYDPEYELSGKDYPLPFVRWTEKRNFDAVLHCMTSGTLHVKPLISEKVQFDDTPSIYSNLSQSKSIATIIEYSRDNSLSTSRTINLQNINENLSKAGKLAIIGSGNFTKMALLPVLHKINAPIGYICSQSELASYLSKNTKFLCTTDLDQVLNDANVKSIFITTRHKSHADLCIQALKKETCFCRKPLATNREQLQSISSFLLIPGITYP